MSNPTDRDPRVEAKFLEWNVDYRHEPEFPVDKMRLADWAQVRFEANRAPKDIVEEYRVHMSNGAAFPPIVLMSPDVLIDGNTRRAAAILLRRKTFPVYIGDFTTPKLAKAFAAALNNMGGKRLSPLEAAEAARELMEQGFADESIAREIGRSIEQVRRVRNEAELFTRAERLKLTEQATALSPDQRIHLNRIKHDPPLAEALELVAKIKPDRGLLRDLVVKIDQAPSDADAIDVIAAARRDWRPAGPPPHRVTVPFEIRQASMHLGGLLKLAENPAAVLDEREDQREATIGKWQRVHEFSAQMLELYGTREPVPA